MSNMDMQIDSLQSEVKYKTEQASKLQRDVFAKELEAQNIRREVARLREENERLKKSLAEKIQEPVLTVVNKAPVMFESSPVTELVNERVG